MRRADTLNRLERETQKLSKPPVMTAADLIAALRGIETGTLPQENAPELVRLAWAAALVSQAEEMIDEMEEAG
jgi:hypothetical protein